MFGFRKKNIEPTELLGIVVNVYSAFYEQYGYDQRLEPKSALIFITERLKEGKLLLSESQAKVTAEFCSGVFLFPGDFPALVKNVMIASKNNNQKEFENALGKIYGDMALKGFLIF